MLRLLNTNHIFDLTSCFDFIDIIKEEQSVKTKLGVKGNLKKARGVIE